MSGNLTMEVLRQAQERLREATRPAGYALGAVRIVTSPHMTERVPYPRSPGRAKRRARMGHPQHYAERPMRKALQLPDGSLVMHPAMESQMRARIDQMARARMTEGT